MMLLDDIKTYAQYFLPKQAITRMAGFLAEVKIPFLKNFFIQKFIRVYGVNLSEACESNPKNYPDFNTFFIRKLRPECRPIASALAVSPVDGVVSEIGTIEAGLLLQAKGRYYAVDELLALDKTISQEFQNGLFSTLYLSPKDYHRVHMPMDGTLKKMVYVPGALFSVQPKTAARIPKLFVSNERVVALFDTSVGLMAMVLVGATIVGSIHTTFGGATARSRKPHTYDVLEHDMSLKKAEEMGYFKLGSTVILLFANSKQIQWLQDIKAGSPIRLGEAIGRNPHPSGKNPPT